MVSGGIPLGEIIVAVVRARHTEYTFPIKNNTSDLSRPNRVRRRRSFRDFHPGDGVEEGEASFHFYDANVYHARGTPDFGKQKAVTVAFEIAGTNDWRA